MLHAIMLLDKKTSPPTRNKLIDIPSTTNINTSVAQSLWYRRRWDVAVEISKLSQSAATSSFKTSEEYCFISITKNANQLYRFFYDVIVDTILPFATINACDLTNTVTNNQQS